MIQDGLGAQRPNPTTPPNASINFQDIEVTLSPPPKAFDVLNVLQIIHAGYLKIGKGENNPPCSVRST